MSNILSQREEIITALFKKGNLSYALQKHQIDLYDLLWSSIKNEKKRKVAVNCSRRFTKTSTSLVTAFEYCIKNSAVNVIFVAPVRGELKTIIKNIVFSHILKHVSKDVQPEHVESRHEFLFQNGSALRMYGANGGNADTIRGNAADLIIVDEAAQIDDLEYVLKSILFPCTLTTRGLTICLSTPGLMPDNYFHEFCDDCKHDHTYFERTIYDNTSLSKEDIDDIAKMCGGYESDTFQREFLCKIIRDRTLAIVPEYTPELKEKYIKPDSYLYLWHFLSMDFGTKDNTAMVFATLDYTTGKLFVECEYGIVGHEVTVANISTECKRIEDELGWGLCKNIFRVGDNSDPIVLQSLSTPPYSYPVTAIQKTSLNEMVSELRTAIKNGKVKIDPNCVRLLSDIEIGAWDKNREKFARNAYGHCDFLAALIYLWRIAKNFLNDNPIPANFGQTFESSTYGRQEQDYEQAFQWKSALKRK